MGACLSPWALPCPLAGVSPSAPCPPLARGLSLPVVVVVGSAGLLLRTSSKVCTMCTPSRLPAHPAHFTQQRSSCKAVADHQAGWAGAMGGEGSELEVLEWREENVDLRRWQAWRRLGERERRWRG